MGIVDRLRHCSVNTRDEYLHELSGRAADIITRLKGYAVHALACSLANYGEPTECTCGLSALLEEIDRD